MLKRDAAYYAAELERCKLRPESAQRILRRLQAEHEKSAPEKKRGLPSQHTLPWLKAAACLLVALGCSAIAASLPEALLAPGQRAIAHAPARPNIRLDVWPSYGLVETRYGNAVVLRVELVDPEINAQETTITIPDAAGISLYPEDVDWLLIDSSAELATSVSFTHDEAKKFLLVAYTPIAQEAFARFESEGEELVGTSDKTAQKTIDDLRDLRFIATTEDREYVYSIDFSDYPDYHSIGRHLNRSNGLSAPFALTREVHP